MTTKAPSVARIQAMTAGAAAVRRAIPLGCGVLIFSAIVFGPTGLPPKEVLHALEGSAPMRIGLWALWLVLAAAPARALFDTPSSWLLRWLPIPRSTHARFAFVGLTAIAAPWIALFTVGGGIASGLSAGLAASAVELAWIARPSKPLEIAGAIAVVGCIAFGAPAIVLGAVALASSWPLFAGAFDRAPERGGEGRRALDGGRPALALALAIAAQVSRGERAALGRGLAFAAIGGSFAGFLVRNGDGRDAAGAIESALVALALPLAVAAAGVASAAIEIERRLAWLLDATATTSRARAAARLGVAAFVTGFDALIAGILAASIAPVSTSTRLAMVAAVIVWGAAIGVAVAALARGAEKHDGIDGAGVLMRALGTAAASASLAATGGARSIPLVLCGAAALAALDLRRPPANGRA